MLGHFFISEANLSSSSSSIASSAFFLCLFKNPGLFCFRFCRKGDCEILVSVNDGLQVYGLFTGMKPPRLSPHSIRALAFDSWAVSCSLFLMRAQSN